MTVLNNIQDWQSNAESLFETRPEWLTEQQSNAFKRFEEIGLPTLRYEEWRYTNLAFLKKHNFALAKATAELTVNESTIDLPSVDHPRLVLVDGHVSNALSDIGALPDSVLFDSFSAVLQSQPERLQGLFGATLPTQESHAEPGNEKARHGFIELNTALATDGYVIIADKGAQLKQPIEIVFITTAESQEQVSHTRNIIHAGAQAELKIIERYISIGADSASDSSNDSKGEQKTYLNNSITEIIADDNSHIAHYRIQSESEDAVHYGAVFTKLQRDANVANHNFSLGGLVVRNDITMQLLGNGAHAEMNGLVFGKGKQHIDNFTEVNHVVANCTSDEYYKNVLDDRSRSIFRGRIIVAQDAQQTSAEQQNNNLLLSKSARSDSKPQLEIYADDVQCSHGATVGQLDPKSIFYLQSRGIDEATARTLLTFAFANEVIERIGLDSVRDELTHLLAGQLVKDIEDVL